MSGLSFKSLHEIVCKHGISATFVAECFHYGLIASRTRISARDERRLQIASKGRALGFTLSEIKILVMHTPQSLNTFLSVLGSLVAASVLIEIVDPALIEAAADVLSVLS